MKSSVGMVADERFTTVIGVPLDQTTLRHDPTWAVLALSVLLSSAGLAAAVPAALIMTSGYHGPGGSD